MSQEAWPITRWRSVFRRLLASATPGWWHLHISRRRTCPHIFKLPERGSPRKVLGSLADSTSHLMRFICSWTVAGLQPRTLAHRVCSWRLAESKIKKPRVARKGWLACLLPNPFSPGFPKETQMSQEGKKKRVSEGDLGLSWSLIASENVLLFYNAANVWEFGCTFSVSSSISSPFEEHFIYHSRHQLRKSRRPSDEELITVAKKCGLRFYPQEQGKKNLPPLLSNGTITSVALFWPGGLYFSQAFNFYWTLSISLPTAGCVPVGV